jgi:hypothetical protein
MTTNESKRVAHLLHRQAELVERAALQIRELADRAGNGDVGSVHEGLGYHYLVNRAQAAMIAALANIPFGQAFQAAAAADKAEG